MCSQVTVAREARCLRHADDRHVCSIEMQFGSFAVAVCDRVRSRWWVSFAGMIGGGAEDIATLDRTGRVKSRSSGHRAL